jgi:hypothetical protein
MGSVDEDFDIAFVDFNLDGHVSVRPKWKVTYLAGVGYAFYNKADNGLFGKVDGDGGVLVHAGIGFEYLLSDAHRVGAGVRYEYQNLDGGQRDAIIQVDGQQVPGVVEWPDNKLTQFWFDVHWIATF